MLARHVVGDELVVHGEHAVPAVAEEAGHAHPELGDAQQEEQREEGLEVEREGAEVGEQEEEDVDDLQRLVEDGPGLLVRVVEAVGGDAVGGAEEEKQEAAPGDDELVAEGGRLHQPDRVGHGRVAQHQGGPDGEAQGGALGGAAAGAQEDKHREQGAADGHQELDAG